MNDSHQSDRAPSRLESAPRHPPPLCHELTGGKFKKKDFLNEDISWNIKENFKAGPGIKFQEGAYKDAGAHPKSTSNVVYTRQKYNTELGSKSNIDRLKAGLINLIKQKQEMNELRVKMQAS